MPKRTDLQSILILGFGPIVIGQAAGLRLQRHAGRAGAARRGPRVIVVRSPQIDQSAFRGQIGRGVFRSHPGFRPLPMSSKRKMRRRGKPAGQLLEIMYGPMEQAWYARLSPETREAMPGLHALVQDDPRAAVTELRSWIAREPLPMFFNWLSAAYNALGETAALEDVIRENYQRNPHYLFARLNYAELCLRDGDLAGAREALGAGFDIRPLLGGRKRIHVSELTGYYYAVGLYHIEVGDRDAAEKMYALLKHAAPGEPPTEELRRRLHPRLRDLFRR